MMRLLICFLAGLLLLARADTGGSNSRNGAATDVIFLGDSWAEGGGDAEFVQACPSLTMANRAVGGSTASSWSGGELDSEGCTVPGAISGMHGR